jgi:hypothetical protein
MRAEAALDRSAEATTRMRGEPRAALFLTSQLRIDATTWRPAHMVDLSCAGFRLAWLPSCPIGRQLWVRLPGLEALPATVRWRDHRGVGCQFARPLNAVIVEHFCRKGAAQTA